MEGQEQERRGIPSITFFDGKGDEVGGMAFGVKETADASKRSATSRWMAHNQDQVRSPHALPSSGMARPRGSASPSDRRFRCRTRWPNWAFPCGSVQGTDPNRDGADSRGRQGRSTAGIIRYTPSIRGIDSGG